MTYHNEYYENSDLALVGALCCHGYTVEGIDKSNPQRVVFSVRRDERLDDLLQAYWSHKLLVDPIIFFGVLKELKTRIYQ